jgi:ferredoxin
MNLLSIAEHLASLDWSPIHVDVSRCLRSIDRHSTCEQCVQTCPTHALSLGAPITLNVDACVACGQCLHDCPTGALTGTDKIADLWSLAERPENAHTLEIACSRHPSPEAGPAASDAVLRFGGCLAALSPAAYLGLLSSGFAQVSVRLDVCSACPIGMAEAMIERTVAMTQQLLAARQEADRLAIINNRGQGWAHRPVYAKKTDLSRRDLFRRFAPKRQPQSGNAVQIADTPVDEEQLSNAKQPPRERKRLLKALRRMPPVDRATASSLRLEKLPFARITADEKCDACGACARICPTGALRLVESGGSHYELTFAAGDCIDCGVCLKVCAPEALHREDPTLSDLLEPRPVTLRAGAWRQCSRCNAKFASSADSTLCPICEFRRQHPLGRRLPPGLLRQHTKRTVDATPQK